MRSELSSNDVLVVASGDASTGPGFPPPGAGLPTPRRRRRWWIDGLALAPFFVYVGLALLLPIVAIVVLALQTRSGHLTWHNMSLLTSGVYRAGFVNSLEVSLEASLIPGVIGLVVAYALASIRHPVVQRIVASASAVLANFGGVNLAFIFIAAYGTTGLTTQWLSAVGFNPWNHGFSLFNFAGIVFIYCYFQIPLMVLVVTPALSGLKAQWREAAEGLGAGPFTYWRRVGLPVLAPAILGAVLLLFGSAFSAYATAEALTSGSVALAPILIGNFLNGNVIAGQEHIGYAISVGMMIILLVTTVFYVLAQRRSQKWLRS